MRKTIASVCALLATALLAACGSGSTTTVVQTTTKTVVVDTSARIADFKEQDYRGAMIDWFEREMCGNDSTFMCRCVTDRINWQYGPADDYQDFVIDLIREKAPAVKRAEQARQRCRALTSDSVLASLPDAVSAVARAISTQLKRTTARVLGEGVTGAPSRLTCAEWSGIPKSVRRVFAREVQRSVAWEAYHARDTGADVLSAINAGCDEHPDDLATGWIASEIALATGGESDLP